MPTCLFAAFLALALPALALARPDAEPEPSGPGGKVEVAIAQGIKLLEAKKYKEFLKTILSPEDLKRFSGTAEQFEKFAAEFGAGHADRLLKVLKSLKGKKPTLEEGGKLALYKVDVKGAPLERIRFRLVEKRWYLLNN